MIPFIGQNLICIMFAFLLDDILSDPRTFLHPVSLLGRLNRLLEKILYPLGFTGGVILTLISCAVAGGTAYGLLELARGWHYLYLVANTLIIYTSLSAKSMTEHAKKVYEPLSQGLNEAAASELSLIVSRDTEGMNKSSIVKSTIESVSENYTDGVLSPALFAALGGGTGAMLFKAVSTLDSMFGYKNEKYRMFGKFPARLDDLLNFVPARLSVVIIAVSAPFCRLSSNGAMLSALKYRLAHESPNSAHSMAAFAGALGVRLGGPASYFGKLKNKPFIGEGEEEPDEEAIISAIKLFQAASTAIVFLCLVIYLLIRSTSGCPLYFI
jgi:adenosylcobinamide-phosphate synthase